MYQYFPYIDKGINLTLGFFAKNNSGSMAPKSFAIDMNLCDDIECRRISLARRRENMAFLSRLT